MKIKNINSLNYLMKKNGTLIRSDISGTQMNATMRSFPELLDIGIMGQCSAAKAGMCSR